MKKKMAYNKKEYMSLLRRSSDWPYPVEETQLPANMLDVDQVYATTVTNPVGNLVESDPTGRQPHELGAKLDTGKLRPWLFFAGFANALEEVAKVTTLGAEKYTPNGWATVPEGETRYMEAAARHLVALGKGKVLDDGPGGLGSTYHKAQVIWNLLASLELELRNKT